MARRPLSLGRAGAALALLTVTAAACAAAQVTPPDDPPWKETGQGVVITAAPDAGGVLSFRNCPTLDEARAEVPAITSGPDANAVPFKSMVLQCSYGLPGLDSQLRGAGITILVFDAVAEGRDSWAWTGLDSPTAIPDIGERAFATRQGETWEVFVDAGRFGLHLLNTSPDHLDLASLTSLARVAIGALERPPR